MSNTFSQPDESNENLRLYVLVDKQNLSFVQCGIQAAHSIHELIFSNKNHPKLNAWGQFGKTLIFLEATEEQIKEKMTLFKNQGKIYKEFYEPDMNNKLTACSFEPMFPHQGKQYFKGFKLI